MKFTDSFPGRMALRLATAAFLGLLSIDLVATAQQGANHGAAWTSADIVHVDLANGVDNFRQQNPGWGGINQPYRTVQHAVADVLGNAPRYPIVFNIGRVDHQPTNVVHAVSDLRLPAHGVKLQPYTGATVILDGGGDPSIASTRPPVLFVDSAGPRWRADGSAMPATIIQGLTITGGGTGVKLDVAAAGSEKPLRTEVRDCVITSNKYFSYRQYESGIYFGGIGIWITSKAGAATQYVVEGNSIFDQADFCPNHDNPTSYGIRIDGHADARESSLIRGNQLHEQETGIGIYGSSTNTWVRPRILSNFLRDHEQHVWSRGDCGPVLVNNTIFRVRDYCIGPDRHIIHHDATPLTADENPSKARTAMIVRNCIIDYTPVAPIQPGGTPSQPPPAAPGTPIAWPINAITGSGTVDVAWTDLDWIAPNPNVVFGPGNHVGRPIPFASTADPVDLHLVAALPNPAPMIEGGDLESVDPGSSVWLDGVGLPCDARTDVDGDVRIADTNGDGSLLPERGGDEVQPMGTGLRLTSTADRNGNVQDGSTVVFTIEGRPNELVALFGWFDCPTDANDDVVYNNFVLAPVGNVLLPPCGLVNSAAMFLDQQGRATVPLTLAAGKEFQAYFQALGLSASGAPTIGLASKRLRIELN
ncbi:MAG: hypothetical protein RL112_1586 [Planctomycetota bacterium]